MTGAIKVDGQYKNGDAFQSKKPTWFCEHDEAVQVLEKSANQNVNLMPNLRGEGYTHGGARAEEIAQSASRDSATG